MKRKRRILSLLLCGAMLFSLCSQPALAEGNRQADGVTIGAGGLCEHHPEHNADCGYTEGSEGTPCNFVCEICNPQNSGGAGQKPDGGAQEQCSCVTLCTEGNINRDCPVCGAEDADLALCEGEAKTATPSNAETVTVASVQAMIDALPDAEEITEDNIEEVKAQLEAIDEAKEKLSDEEIDELDMTRYAEAAIALGALAVPMLAEDITWPTIGGTVTIGEIGYIYKKDCTSAALDLTSSSYSGNCIFKAGSGYVLWNSTDKKIILHDATITEFFALEVPSDAQVVVEGTNTLHGTGSYALVCYSGGITVTGSGSLSTLTDSTGFFDYAVNAGSGDISIDIAGDFTSNGIQAQSSNVTVKSGGTVEVTGLVRAGSAVTVEAGDSLSITNTANMAVQSINSGSVSLTAKNGNITVSGGRNYAGQYNAIQATNGSVTLDASGEIQVAGYNGYPGIGGGSLTVSGTIPAGTTLHTNCAVIVPAGKTLVNNGTLSLNSGGVTVEGTLSYGAGSSIQNGSGTAITPTTTGNGSISTAPVSASRLDFRFNAPDSVTEYVMTGGGTAKWEPGSNGTANKLTLNGVTMTDDYNVVGVPANTEIALIGTNKITATSGTAIWAQGGPLKIFGAGSLEVTALSNKALWSNTSSIDVNITGALTVNGNIRAENGTLSLQSDDAISVTGSMYGKQKITAIAGKSLSITNTSGTAVLASSCTEVSLAAQGGDLTVSGAGSGGYGIYGVWNSTALKLHASGNVSVTGTKYSMQGKTLELSGTIPKNSTLTADGTKSLTVPAGKTLINNGTIKLISYPGAVTVSGTLTNNGSIVNEDDAPIRPTVSGNGVITVKAAMDFTQKDTDVTGEDYSWDYDSKTLTLTNYNMTEPCNDTAIILPDGAKLVLNGENTLKSKNGTLIDAKGTLEISGTGSLTGSAGGEAALNAKGALTITDCKLDLTNPSRWKNVICTNGNALTITGSADVSLHTAEGSGFGIKTGTGGNFTLGSDAKLVITGATGILAQGASVKIAGTLDVSGCANRGANLLGVTLNMEGSSITAATGDNQGIYLNGTLTGQTNIQSFTGVFKLTSSDTPIVNCYTVKKDDTLGLYAVGSTVTFTAETIEGKPFASWTATGVTLTDSTKATISFTMPGNNVTLTTAYRTLVSDVSLDKSELSLIVGGTQTLTVTVQPSNAENKDVTWSSSDSAVASVDENGLVTANKAGTTTITVTAEDGGKTAVCIVTVRNPSYTLTFNTNGGTINSGNITEYTYGVGATLPTDVTRTGYTFKGWYDNENLTGSPVTAISNTETGNKEYWAKWEGNTGGSSSSSGGGSSSSSKPSTSTGGGSSSSEDRDDPSGNAFITDRPNKDNPNTPTTGQTTLVKPTTNGNANINKSAVQQAIDKAAADAKKNGSTANGIAVVVPVNVGDTRKDVQITLKADTLDKLVSSKVKRFTIDTDRMADFDFTLDTLKELNRQTSGDIVLKVKKTTVPSAEAKTAIGTRPAYDISLWEVKNGKETQIAALNGKTISIAIPYTPAKDEQTGNLYAVYVDENGKVQWLTKSSYDADRNAVIFEAAHFSIYGVGYKSPVPNFTDISGHWAKEHILFTVSRGLFSGTSETTFNPNTALTRGMFVTALGRLAGIDPADNKNGKFTDVKTDAYYAPYVNWAASKGIVNGTGATTFAPDNKITREQMAVIMKNYADKMGYSIPKTLEAVTFADNAQISSWAKNAVKAMQQAGVLSDKANNLFDPKGNATRAEAATVLHRFVEIVIDPQTANGWVQNDSGQWSYYRNGESVKGWLSDDQKWYWLDKNTGKMFSGGWKQIDGKWYYFYADGSMAVNTTVDGKTIGADGARK